MIMKLNKLKIYKIFLYLTFLLIFFSCSNENNEKESLLVEDLFNLANLRINDSESFRFILSHENGFTSLPGDYKISYAEGNIEKPDKLLIKAEIISNNFLIKLSYLTMENDYWITNPINFNWIKTPEEDNPFKNIKPINILSEIFSEIEDESIMNVDKNLYQVEAKINSENLKSLVGDIIIPQNKVNVELFMTDDGIVERINIYGKVQPQDSSNTIRKIKFENWNQAILWEKP